MIVTDKTVERQALQWTGSNDDDNDDVVVDDDDDSIV